MVSNFKPNLFHILQFLISNVNILTFQKSNLSQPTCCLSSILPASIKESSVSALEVQAMLEQ